jgi:hypothetical protein
MLLLGLGMGFQCLREPRRACPELVERGRLNFRPVQISFERCLGSATTLSLQRPSFLSSRAKPRDLRCAIRVPRSYRPKTPPIITESSWKHEPPLCHSGFQECPRNRRSFGFAPPDFLLRWVALANFMRLSFRERRTRNRVQRSVQEIRVGMTKRIGSCFHEDSVMIGGVLGR